MNRPANPYNIHALYANYNPWHEGRACPLYCGTNALPPTQVKLASSTSGSSYSAYITNPDIGWSTEVTSEISRVCTTDGVFFEYSGDNLATYLDEGFYQLNLNVGATEYYGYPYCARTPFAYNSIIPVPSISCSSSGAGNYTLDFGLVNEIADFGYNYEYNAGSGWVNMGTTSGQITQADWGGSGTVSNEVRIAMHRGNVTDYTVYRVAFNAASPCSISTTLLYSDHSAYEHFAAIEWTNANDLQNLGIRYAGGYTQKFYFEGHEDFPVPILEDTFIANGAAGLTFESAIISQQVSMDFYPVPMPATLPLSAIRLHGTINARNLWSSLGGGGTESAATDFSFTPTEVGGALCQQGRFSWQRDRQYIGGCQEDFTTQSCS